eukprot:PhM_4_TR15877/c0_g1_i1/m.84811/K14852/RRS1; regulator of ribosome biosynthesis
MSCKTDVAHLACFYPGYAPLSASWSSDEHMASIGEATIACVSQLVGQLQHLPSIMTDDGKIVDCPLPVYAVPREKPLPKKSDFETPWEQFAKKKGIRLHQKKQNKVWDDNLQEWRDKWGKRAREHERKYDWISEVGTKYRPDAVGGDPFLDKKQRKKERLSADSKRQERNEKRREAHDLGLGTKDRGTIKGLHATGSKLATASMGKFDKEPKKRKLK